MFHTINMNQNEFTMVQRTVSWVFGFFLPALGKLLQDCFIPFVADAQDNTFHEQHFHF